MEISNELRARIFAAHMPCAIKVGDETRKLIGVGWGEGDLQIAEWPDESCESLSDWICNFDDCKLILKPLEQISDADCIEVAKILIPQCFERRTKGWAVRRDFTVTDYPYIKIHHALIMYSVQIDPKLVNFDVDNMDDRETGAHDMRPAAIIDFLRSKSYDCGYGNIPSLIKENIAVSVL